MYYRAREQVLSALKRQAQRVQGLSETDFCEGRAQGGLPGAYTLCSLRDNLYVPPDPARLAAFSDGGKTQDKLAYLGSSAALLLNLLDLRCVKSDPHSETDRIFYRRRLRVLRSKNACTTIDAILLSESGESCTCMDVRLLEWFVYRVNPLRDGFLHSVHYAEPAAAACFPEAFAILIPYYQADAYEHVGCLRYYDGFFVLRQLLSLYHTIWEQRRAEENARCAGARKTELPALQRVRRLTYMSVYWRLRHAARLGGVGLKIEAAAAHMEREAALFRDLTAPVARLFRETLDVELRVRLTDMWTFLEESGVLPTHAAWMQRYAL